MELATVHVVFLPHFLLPLKSGDGRLCMATKIETLYLVRWHYVPTCTKVIQRDEDFACCFFSEHFRVRCTSEIVPKFWSHFSESMVSLNINVCVRVLWCGLT